jgi:pyruvate carboxylase
MTEEVTLVDLVQAQIRIAGGTTLAELGLSARRDRQVRGFAIQCRVTTEDPLAVSARHRRHRGLPLGGGVRHPLDGGSGYDGASVSPTTTRCWSR